MAKLPVKVSSRLSKEIPRFQKILSIAKDRDVNEADTVTIINDMLESVFGFDKYSEITREYAIKSTYCDLAVKINEKIEYLIEVKAIGIELNESHLRQAINYAANEGIQWVVLTNGIHWEVFRVTLKTKVIQEKVASFNFLELSSRRADDQALLFPLCRGGVSKNLIDELYEHKKSVNRFNIGAIIQSDPLISVIRRELRKCHQGLKVTEDEIAEIIQEEVLKRDVVESENAIEARKRINRFLKKNAVKKKS